MAFVVHARAWEFLCDDAFISFRYAENWVAGRGLVFNAGEQVEGYTNFSWTMLCALGMQLGIEPALAPPGSAQFSAAATG